MLLVSNTCSCPHSIYAPWRFAERYVFKLLHPIVTMHIPRLACAEQHVSHTCIMYIIYMVNVTISNTRYKPAYLHVQFASDVYIASDVYGLYILHSLLHKNYT